ncbi:hypothetical protein, partial [Methylicorpusculum sp.]|uniref:hypothetical protein n=1 Tax=Methylicorpusculum sp. TaxID=2713644 RepID=UPI0027325C19
DKFHWPKSDDALLTLTGQQLNWLLDGFDISAMKGHKKLHSGSRYFCESLFWASQPKQAAKKNATTVASGGPDSSASPRFDPTRGRNIGSRMT